MLFSYEISFIDYSRSKLLKLFLGRHSRTLFFVAPQLLFQIVNIVLFIKTAVYCIRVKNEIKKMNDSARSGKYNADKGR